jgi:16S rRNA G1207 methylase RsmC
VRALVLNDADLQSRSETTVVYADIQATNLAKGTLAKSTVQLEVVQIDLCIVKVDGLIRRPSMSAGRMLVAVITHLLATAKDHLDRQGSL